MASKDEVIALSKKKCRIFFYRICGTGMGACASLLRAMGHEIEGVDFNFYPPMSTYLSEAGIKTCLFEDFDPESLKGFDLIVVGNAVHRLSEHARIIERSGVAFSSFPAVLGAFVLNAENVVGVCGTHGKTTTTYFLAQIYENIGLTPGYFIGAILDGRAPARLSEGGAPFFIEADEYDSAYFHKFSKFRLYELNSMILTSLEFDHADIFNSLEDIEKEFEFVLPQIDGVFVGNSDYPSITKIASKHLENKNTYSYGDTSSLGPKSVSTSNCGSSFFINWEGEELKFNTSLVGKHNIENLCSAIVYALRNGISYSELSPAVEKLVLAKRRQELIGNFKGMPIIDDFAHHPTAVKVTIDAISSQYPGKKILAVFEPMSATSRSELFQKKYIEVFGKCARLLIVEPGSKTTVEGVNNLDTHLLVDEIRKYSGIEVGSENHLDGITQWIERQAGDESVLLVMSNNTCMGLWNSEFMKRIIG